MTAVAAGTIQVSEGAGRRHFPSLDGYRGMAAMLVLLCHAALLSGLNHRTQHTLGPYLARTDIGVAIFFLLSGFLIYRPFAAAHIAGTEPMGPRQFYRRRVLRILPAYWVALTLVAYVLHAPGFRPADKPWMHYLFLHVYDINQVINGPVQQSWSLATEISFYAFVPIYAWLIRRGRSRRSSTAQARIEIGGAAALVVGSVGLKLVLLAAGISAAKFGQIGTWLPLRLDAFGLGMMLCSLSVWSDRADGPSLRVTDSRWFTTGSWLIAAFGYWVMCTKCDLPLGPILDRRQTLIVHEMYPAIALFMVLPGFFGPDRKGLFRRIMAHPFVAWFGLISYGIYIWHEAFLTKWFAWTHHHNFNAPFWQVFSVNLVITIPVAALSYYAVERPFLKLKSRR